MGRVRKNLLNKLTTKFTTKMNARVSEWRKHGIDDEVIQERLRQVNDIEGFTVNAKGKIVASEDITEDSALALLASLPTRTKLVKEIAEPMESLVSEAEKEERERRAAQIFDLEMHRLRNDAAEQIWDIWYAKHEGFYKHRIMEQNSYLSKLDRDVKADLADKLYELGVAMGRDEASAEEILNLYTEMKEELKKAGVSL